MIKLGEAKVSPFLFGGVESFTYICPIKIQTAMSMTQDNIYFKWFWESLREDQKKDYRDMSINQQKDWYISYLESKYSAKKEDENLANTLFTSETQEQLQREFEGESDEEIEAERKKDLEK